MEIVFNKEEVAKAIEYYLREKHLSTYKVKHTMDVYYDREYEAWVARLTYEGVE